MKTLILVVALIGCTTAFADATPRVDQRQENQDARIEHGQANGELTARESVRLEAQQDRIAHMESHAKSDGDVTARERARLHRAENRASRNIRRQKHDRQDRF